MSTTIHCGGIEVRRDQLYDVGMPERQVNDKGHITYQPIAHASLLELVEKELRAFDINIIGQRHYINKDGGHYFAQLELDSQHDDYCSLVGIRNSHLRDMAAGLAMGSRVFVCDNLCFSGDIVINRKHSRFINRDIPGLVTDGVARLMHVEKNQEARYGLYKEHYMDSEEAEHAFIRCLELGVLGRSPRLAWEDWKTREDWGRHPTAWRFMNNVTAGWNSQPTQPTMFAKSRKLLAVLDGTTRFTPLPPPEVGAEVEDTEVVLREVA